MDHALQSTYAAVNRVLVNAAGQLFRPDSAGAFAPPAGLLPMFYWKYLGRLGRHHEPRRTNRARPYSSDYELERISRTTLGAMRAVIQVASSASVTVDDQVVGELPRPGLMILLGVHVDDSEAEADVLVDKIVNLRILGDEESAIDLNAPVLVISQFTLNADVRKGRRPSWSKAARPEQSEPLYEYFVTRVREHGVEVHTGQFGAMMDVGLVNSGPFTLVIDSDDLAAPRRG